jgi:hypothetical protein
MTIALVIYALLILAFLLGFGLVIRHQSDYGYLSPRFRKVVTVVAVFAVILVSASVFFAYLLMRDSAPESPSRSYAPSSNIQF